MNRKQLSDLFRRAALVVFDLADGGKRTADKVCQRFLREVELLAAGFEPRSKSICIHNGRIVSPNCVTFCVTECHLMREHSAYHAAIERRRR